MSVEENLLNKENSKEKEIEKSNTENTSKVKKNPLELVIKYRKLILFIIVVIALIVVIFFVVKKLYFNKNIKVEVPENRIEEDIPGIKNYPESVISLGEFIVNLNSLSEKHYLKVSISLELDKKETEAEIKMREAQLKDMIIGMISTRNSEDILKQAEKDKIKKEIINSINLLLQKDKVLNVYFTDFVVQ